MGSNGTIQVDVQMPELPDTQLVTVDLKEGANGQKLALAKGNSYDFVFGTSVEAGTPIRVFYRQCTTGEDGESKCTDFAPNDHGKQYHFNTTEDKTQIHRIAVPKNESFVVDESLTDSTVTTSLWMVATLCGEGRFSHKQFMVVTEHTAEKLTRTLSAGAIVGIVAAVLLVIALTAWWLVMRN